MRSPRWISALSIAAVLSATLLAAIWSFTAPRGAGKGGSPGSSPSRRETRPDANEVIARIQEAVRANRFEELRKLEDGLAAFGESALPEIRRALLVGTPGNDGMVEFWNSGSMHPRAKLHLLAVAARVESESAELLLDEFARTPGPAQEAWLRMTARDMMDERERGKNTNPKSQITKKSKITNLNDGQDGSRGRSPYPVAAGAAGVTPAGTTGAEPSASARLASGPAAREAAAQELATALREEPDRKKRLDTIDALIAIPGEEGSKALERFILENRDDQDREWEVNRALRLLIERHGASQELGPFRWVLREEPALALRSIEAAAHSPSPQGLAFLLAVRESFPQGHPLRLRADAAIARRQANEAK